MKKRSALKWWGIFIIQTIVTVDQTRAQSTPEKWTVTYELSAKIDVAINPSRLLHGPAAVVAPNGDWLVAYQDSIDHSGRDGVISQVRSSDQGRSWKPDGIVYDQRNEQFFGRNPAYGLSGDGLMVLVVQRWRPLAPGAEYVRGKEEGIWGSVYLISRDNGKTYQYRGLVDPEVPLRHQGTTGSIIRDDQTLFMAAESLGEPPRGITLYTSDDPMRGWRFGGWIFRLDQVPDPSAGYGLSYGSLVRRQDGSWLAVCNRRGRNLQTVSYDQGRTWKRPWEPKKLRIRNNADLDYAGRVLVAHGRGEDVWSVVLYFSPDEGETWGHPIILDRHGLRGGGGYTASLRTKTGNLFIVFSTDAGPNTGKNGGKPDIRGVLLSQVEIRRTTQQPHVSISTR